MDTNSPQLILGSSSTTRQDLLSRLNISFITLSPHIDETRKPNESPKDLVVRLAIEKAQSILQRLQNQDDLPQKITQYDNFCIVASDEVMINLDKPDKIIGKPLIQAKALQQSMQNANSIVHFYTSLCLLHYAQPKTHLQTKLLTTEVKFKNYDEAFARHIMEIDQPLQCAGAFRSEGASIRLCEYIKEPEPGALMGLPLISLNNYLSSLLFGNL